MEGPLLRYTVLRSNGCMAIMLEKCRSSGSWYHHPHATRALRGLLSCFYMNLGRGLSQRWSLLHWVTADSMGVYCLQTTCLMPLVHNACLRTSISAFLRCINDGIALMQKDHLLFLKVKTSSWYW